MHDKYCYERAEMALHDRDVKRYFATGVAGLSIVVWIDILAQYLFQFSGSLVDQRTVKFGSGEGPKFVKFVDHFIMKLRCVKFARTPEYNQIFAGDPVWVTESLGGVGAARRFLHEDGLLRQS